MSTTQMKPGFRRIRARWYALALVLSLGIATWALYATGAYDSWRDGRSLDQACEGTLAQGGLTSAVGTSHLRAEQTDDSALADCFVKDSSSRNGRAVHITLRWSTSGAPSGTDAGYQAAGNGVQGQAAPLGNGWPGVIRDDGKVMVALDCVNQKSKALVAYGELYGASDGNALTGLGQVTTETAQNAAEKYGCEAKAGKQLTGVYADQLGKSGTPKPLAQAQGSCEALRGTKAAENGTPQFMEYPTDAHAPQINCYLVTKDQKPGYGLYAYYGTAAKDFQSATSESDDKNRALATAKCPQSAQEAVFAIYRLYERDTDTFPVARYSAEYAKSALKTFADHEAQLRGCTDVRLVSVP
ncbi:hypothetical protein [Streptomyces sp. NPDC059828]|uniref:hypothetical protein n=1 Tax=Streptomyces sp. NPDC059828 TaxID=3346965 RepID=UPI00365918AC